MKGIIRALILCCALAGIALAASTVNINTADAVTLAESIKGVGLTKAEAIVQYREQYGPFESVEELADVPGVGGRTVEINRAILRVHDENDADSGS